MSDPSWTIYGSTPADVIISADGTKLYVATGSAIQTYDTATGALTATWSVGASIGAIDISPDGSFIMAVGTQASYVANDIEITNTIISAYKISTVTGQVTTYSETVPGFDFRFYDVAILSNGTVLFSKGDSYSFDPSSDLNLLDLSTGIYSTVASIGLNATLTRSIDGSEILISTHSIFSPNFMLFRAGEGIVASHDAQTGLIMGGFTDDGFSLEGNLVSQGAVIYDSELNLVINLHKTLLHMNFDIVDVAFDATGENMYVLNGNSNSIVQISTSDWQVVRSFAVGADVQSSQFTYPNRLLLSPDGSFFSVITESGVQIVTLDAEVTDFTGYFVIAARGDDLLTGPNDSGLYLFGGMGNDTLIGGDSDGWGDWLDGGPGTDIMTGGKGGDMYIVDSLDDQVIENPNEGWDNVVTNLGGGSTLQERIANAYQMTFANVEILDGDDTAQGLRGTAGNDTISAGGGDDYLDASGGGRDYISGDEGRDVIYYGAALTGTDSNDGGTSGGDARGDLLVIQGDYTLTLTLGLDSLDGIEKFRTLKGGFTGFGDTAGNLYDYDIKTIDSTISAGTRLVVQGGSLQLGEHLKFDGSAETDGSFQMFGGHDSDELTGGAQGDHLLGRAGNDILTGNGGDDRLRGGLGADAMDGAAGADTFVYAAQGGAEPYSNAALESTGTGYDTITGFNFVSDKIDLPQTVTAFSSINAGALSNASFNADLAAAVDATLAVNGAVLFTANNGDLAGKSFLVVDADGNGSYEAGHDFVIHLLGATGTVAATPTLFV